MAEFRRKCFNDFVNSWAMKAFYILSCLTRLELVALNKLIKRSSTRKDLLDLWQSIYRWFLIVEKSPDIPSLRRFQGTLEKHGTPSASLRSVYLSQIGLLAEDFLLMERIKCDPLLRARISYLAAERKGDEILRKRYLQKFERELTTNCYESSRHFESKKWLEIEHKKLEMQRITRKTAPDYSNIVTCGELSFLLLRLRLVFLDFNNRQIFPESSLSSVKIDRAISWLIWKHRNRPIVGLYVRLIQYLRRPDDNRLIKISGDFYENYEFIEEEFRSEIYTILVNALLQKLNRGDTGALFSLFQLFEWGSGRFFGVTSGRMSLSGLRNLLEVYLRLGMIARAEIMLQKFAGTDETEHYLKFFQAAILHRKGELENAYSKLSDVLIWDDQDTFFRLAYQTLKCKIMAEMNQKGMLAPRATDSFFQMLTAFIANLNRNPHLNRNIVRNTRNLMLLLRRILSTQERSELVRIRTLIIENEIVLDNRNWLLRRCEVAVELLNAKR